MLSAEATPSRGRFGGLLSCASQLLILSVIFSDVPSSLYSGVHGWFPNAIVRYIAGEPTGTSTAFSNKMRHAVETYFQADGRVELDKITVMSLEGEGKVEDRVDKSVSLIEEDHSGRLLLILIHARPGYSRNICLEQTGLTTCGSPMLSLLRPTRKVDFFVLLTRQPGV